jgi:uncharacterized protein involved in exopolysaccharide biosynthesis
MMALGNIKIVRLISGKWKNILIVALISFVVGIVITMPVFMKPKYKSESTVYPANLTPFSLESPTEQLMQLLQSRKLKMLVMRDQQLWKNYKLDTIDPMFEFYYLQLYEEHVKYSQTRYESVNIEVLDEDGNKARAINNSIIKNINALVKKMHDEKTGEFSDMYRRQLEKKRKSIDSVDRVMEEFRTKYGIMDYKIQVREASKNYYKALANGKSPGSISYLNEELQLLKQNGGKFKILDEMLVREVKEYEKIQKEYDDKIRDLNKKFSYTSVVAEPNIPVKKAWPVRWLICLATVFSSVFLAVMYHVVADRIRQTSNS